MIDQELLVAVDHVLEETKILGADHQQDLSAIVSLVLWHVEGHCVFDQQLKIGLDEFVGTSVVGTFDCLFAHLVDADRVANGLSVADQLFVVRLVEVLELIEELELLNHVAQYLPAF